MCVRNVQDLADQFHLSRIRLSTQRKIISIESVVYGKLRMDGMSVANGRMAQNGTAFTCHIWLLRENPQMLLRKMCALSKRSLNHKWHRQFFRRKI